MKNLILLLFMILIGCSIAPTKIQRLNPETFYKRDMIVNGHEGTLVLPYQSQYSFHVEARGKLDLFTMTTCSKEETKEKAWNVTQTIKKGLFGWGKKKIDKTSEVKFSYTPSELERDRFCIMELGGYEKSGGRHSWALIDFESPKFKSKAIVICNGRTYQANGVSVCQARVGLYQSIKFKNKVIVSSKAKCGINDQGSFRIKKGRCTTIFKDIKTKELHKLTTVGYEGILVRGL